MSRCGNEGQHSQGDVILQMLRAAISFVPEAKKEGADLTNAAFMFNHPGREFVVVSGDGDWQYEFSEENGKITSKCSNKPWKYYIWEAMKAVWKVVKTVAPLAIAAGVSAIPGVGPVVAPYAYGAATYVSGAVALED